MADQRRSRKNSKIRQVTTGAPSVAASNLSDPSEESSISESPFQRPTTKTSNESLVSQSRIHIEIRVVHGGITNVKAPIAVCPRYQGMPLAGPAKAFDSLLDTWLTRGLELGMIGSGLGQLYPINLLKAHTQGRINVEQLLLVGMGEPGRFAPDALQYLMSNVVIATKCFGQSQLSTMLIGTRRKELRIESAVRSTLYGIIDGFERFRTIAESVTKQRDWFLSLSEQPLLISVVEEDEEKAGLIYAAFKEVSGDNSSRGIEVHVSGVDHADPDPVSEPTAVDTDPNLPLTLLRITRSTPNPAGGQIGCPNSQTEIFKYSALSDIAAITVRELEVNSHIVRRLPERMIEALTLRDREEIGEFVSNYLIPDDFRVITEGSDDVTFIVDETTSMFPWEMIAHKKYLNTNFLGTSIGVSRQFFSLLSPPPSSLPPLNRSLSVLVIADPAPGQLSLPGARKEGLAVVEMLKTANRAWRGYCNFKVTVRIGSYLDEFEEPELNELRKLDNFIISAERCDPLKLSILIVNNHYDVIHFAGHGDYDPVSGRAGWIFDKDCLLTAQEIFRVRRVPRLVFANACRSAVIGSAEKIRSRDDQRSQLTGLAQAFFRRGIPNYIGTGWEVGDECAALVSKWFYARALGLSRPDDTEEVIGESPPATLGEALLRARREALEYEPNSATWASYQHYGRSIDKLLAFPNRGTLPRSKRTDTAD